MLTTSVLSATRARPLRLEYLVATRAITISGAAGVRQRQQVRGFRFGISYYHSNPRPCRKPKRRDGAPKHNPAEDPNNTWPLGHGFWAWENTYQAIVKEYWSKSRLRPSRNGPYKQRTPDSGHGEQRGHDVEDTKRGSWARSSPENDQGEIHKRQPSSRHEPEPENRGSQYRSTQPGAFFIDPITNRKVAFGSRASEYKTSYPDQDKIEDCSENNLPVEELQRNGQYGREAKPEDVDTAKSGSDATGSAENSSEHRLNSESRGEKKYTQGETAPSQSESKQSTPQYDDLHKYRPITNQSFILNMEEDLAKTKPHEIDSTRDKAQLHFEDLKPPPAQGDGSTFVSADKVAPLFDDVKDVDGEMQYGARRDETVSAKEHVTGSYNDSSDSRIVETDHTSARGDPSPDVANLEDFQTFSSSKADTKPAGYVEESVAPERLHEYPCVVEQAEPGDFSESTIEDLCQKYDTAKIKKYTAVRCHERNGQPENVAQDILTSHERSTEHDQVTINENGHEHPLSELPGKASGYSRWLPNVDGERLHDSQQQLAPAETDIADESSLEPLIKLHDSQTDESVRSKQRARLESMQKLSDAVKQHEMLSDAADREAALAVKQAKARASAQHTSERKLTGNYAKDFPEEFEKSWTQILSSTPTDIFDNSYQQTTSLEHESMDGGLEGAFGRPGPSKIQPALDRHDTAQDVTENPRELGTESSSQKSQEVDNSHVRNGSRNNVEPSHVKHVGSGAGRGEADSDHSDITAEELGRDHESNRQPGTSTTLYKILAYDPTSQTISIAETSSLVADFTSALSPAAALSRLSHPTKFFPHFANLEADGFEIVSGSGDVLVFRKARPSAAEREANKAETDTSAAINATSEPNPTPINPIDMTGRPKFMTPASANFASPTGYVAYPESEAMDLPPPPPRVKYNIDLRREEPVYSGPKTRSNWGKDGQKKSLGKRLLVGGVWVAGISYGLGVVSEYFATGGVDGMGPTGF